MKTYVEHTILFMMTCVHEHKNVHTHVILFLIQSIKQWYLNNDFEPRHMKA